jgi:hypothetical protein
MNHHQGITGDGIGRLPIAFVRGKNLLEIIFGFSMLVVDRELVQNI